MAFPNQSLDQGQLINQVSSGSAGPQSGPWSGKQGFNANIPPSVSGIGTRESQVPNYRDGVSKRDLMSWLLPDGPVVQMYINPARVQYSNKKIITKQKTKGGFALQYYGEDLGTLGISGSTGTSGYEGINVLYEIYRNEQYRFDPYALTLQAERDKADQESFDGLLFSAGSLINNIENTAVNLKSAQKGYYNSLTQSRNKPTLASLGFTMEMIYKGLTFRGYFTDFSVTEAAEHFGLFDYTMNFTVTQTRGYRTNDQAWQKSPSTGPSQSDLHKPGPSYSFGTLVNEQPITNNIQNSSSIIDAFQVY